MQAQTPTISINHMALAAKDPGALASFYERTLGLKRLREQRAQQPSQSLESVWLALGNNVILMLEAAAAEALPQTAPEFFRKSPGYHLLAFSMAGPEREAAIARLAREGVEVIHSSEYTEYFLDPEGNRVGLSSFDLNDYNV